MVGLILFSSLAEAQYVRATAGSFSTSSTTFTDVPGATLAFTPSSASDVWILLLSGRLRSTWTTSDEIAAETRYLVNGTERGLISIRNHGANAGGAFAHFDRVTGTTALQVVTVQLRDAKATATLDNVQIIAFRLPPGADFQFAETSGLQSVPALVWTSMQSLTFTPASAGNYLVMAVSSGRESPDVSTLAVRFQDPAGAFWPVDDLPLPIDPRRGQFENGRTGWPPFLLARVQNLTAAAKTYSIEAQGDALGAEIRDTRIMAFRTDVFDNAQSIETIAMTTTTSTTPVVKSTLNTATPPAAQDHIIIQSLLVDADSSSTDERRAGFERNDSVVASYGLVSTNNEFESSYAFFDAVTTASSMKLENTFSTSNAAYIVEGKESVIHVLRLTSTSCCSLQTTEGAGTVTVTAPASFQMRFNTAVGGGIDELFDLAEDPSVDLAGGVNDLRTLHDLEVAPSGGAFAGVNHQTDDNSAGAKVDLLEATPTRVRVRQDAFFQQDGGANILGGLKGTGDYSVYGIGRTALRWTQTDTNTPAFNYARRQIGMTAHYTAGLPLSNYTPCYEGNPACNTWGGGGAQADWLLGVRNVVNARTDFLTILSQDWVQATTIEYLAINIAGLEFSDQVWQEQPGGGANAVPSQSWNLLTYFKPTNLGSTASPWLDPAVISRSTDYRAPSSLATLTGGPWHLGSENSLLDDFNEAEGAYVLTMDPTNGMIFRIDGSVATPRYQPFFKLRQWRSLSGPSSITLQGAPLTAGVGFRADVKPLSRAHFANILSWHSTLQSAAAVTAPDVGSAGTVTGGVTFVPGRYGNAGSFTAPGNYVTLTFANFNIAIGTVEFWYQPNYQCQAAPGTCDGVRHVLWSMEGDATHFLTVEKTTANQLDFAIRNGAATTVVRVSLPDFAWRAKDWVHIRAMWNDVAGAGQRMRLFVNEKEPAHVDVGGDYSSAGMPVGPTRVGGDSASATTAAGLIDEFHMYRGGVTPTRLGYGGLAASADEFLAVASVAKNIGLLNLGVDPSLRGQYMYFGADSEFWGLNVGLATPGAGVADGDLVWEYWNGTAWTSLESVGGFNDQTRSFKQSGTVSWQDPPTWAPYSVNGGPDLYYVRIHLPALTSYSTIPVEGLIKTDILLLQYCGEITALAQEFVIGPPVPTAVTLSSFSAAARDSAVDLSWTTASELQNLGFHLYRADSEDGRYARITAAVIPGLGTSAHGANYRYVDSGRSNGTTYFYKLEDIETTGKTTLHGPVSATPSSDAPSPTPAASSLITYGTPERNVFRVLGRSSQGVVVELATEGFHAEPQEDGTVRISIPGFEPEASIPVLRPWIEALAGRNVIITSIQASAVESFTGLRPAGAEALEIVATREGTVRAGRRSRRTLLETSGLFPKEAARLLRVGFQGDAKKAQLELAPLRWNSSTGELLLARKLTVRLAFQGRVANERGHRERAESGARNLLARLATTGKGLHEVRYEDVFRTRRGVDVSQLRLSRLGKPVALHVVPQGERFVPGSRLYFLSEGEGANPYAREAVYELELGAGGLVMELGSASPWGEELASYLKTDEYEENRFYQAGLLEARDLWLWDVVMAPSTKSFPFEVNELRSGSSRLTVLLQGTSDFEADPDHHVRLYVNGALQQEVFWDGKASQKVDLDLSPGTLREGQNGLEIENVGDTEAQYSMVMLDRFQVIYPRAASAAGGDLEGSWPLAGTASAQGLGASHLLDVTDETPRWLSGAALSSDGSIRFRVEAGRRYMAVSHDAVDRPLMRAAARPKLKKESLRADYLVIGPSEFSSTAAPLLAHRSKQGLLVKLATLEDVYSEFGFGETRPEAIRDFLSYAYHHWQEPKLRYVLLLGDATYDFKDFLKTGVTNQVPPLMVKTSYLWTVSDPALGAVNGDDILPDVAIGRLPARNPEELRVMVSKILAYETGNANLESLLVLVNDNSDRAGDFRRDADEIALGVLSGRPVRRLSLEELGGTPLRMRTEILRAFDEGASLVSYVGHGGIHLWANENVLNIGDVASLSPQSQQPLLLTMNCLNGYFHFPYFDSLAETLVKAEGKGAIAAFSPSGLSVNEPAHRFHQALLDAVFNQGHPRLGDALLAAQEDYAESGAFPELLSIYHLLGDPGLRLR